MRVKGSIITLDLSVIIPGECNSCQNTYWPTHLHTRCPCAQCVSSREWARGRVGAWARVHKTLETTESAYANLERQVVMANQTRSQNRLTLSMDLATGNHFNFIILSSETLTNYIWLQNTPTKREILNYRTHVENSALFDIF